MSRRGNPFQEGDIIARGPDGPGTPYYVVAWAEPSSNVMRIKTLPGENIGIETEWSDGWELIQRDGEIQVTAEGTLLAGKTGTAVFTPQRHRDKVLKKASELINGNRADDYGDAAENFGRIAKLWAATLGHDVTPAQVALCMAQVKISRLAHTPTHDDSWVDLAGYTGLGAELAAEGTHE